jgi:hypothetical protein
MRIDQINIKSFGSIGKLILYTDFLTIYFLYDLLTMLRKLNLFIN